MSATATFTDRTGMSSDDDMSQCNSALGRGKGGKGLGKRPEMYLSATEEASKKAGNKAAKKAAKKAGKRASKIAGKKAGKKAGKNAAKKADKNAAKNAAKKATKMFNCPKCGELGAWAQDLVCDVCDGQS